VVRPSVSLSSSSNLGTGGASFARLTGVALSSIDHDGYEIGAWDDFERGAAESGHRGSNWT